MAVRQKVHACAYGFVLASVLAVALLRFLPASQSHHAEAPDLGNVTRRVRQLGHAFTKLQSPTFFPDDVHAEQSVGFTPSMFRDLEIGSAFTSAKTVDAHRPAGADPGGIGRRLQAATTTTHPRH
eukprot:s3711_g1.t1